MATTVATVDPEIAPKKPQARIPATGEKTDQHIGRLDQLFNNTASGHDVAAQDKEHHDNQRKFIHAAVEDFDNNLGIDIEQVDQPEGTGKKQRHKDRNSGCEATEEQGKNDQVTTVHDYSSPVTSCLLRQSSTITTSVRRNIITPMMGRMA